MLLLGALIYSSTFLAECGPAVSPETTQAVIRVESAGNPLAIGDNNLKKSFAPKTSAEAVELASRLIAQGHSVDLGLMQINSCHIPSLKLTLEELFDPCTNIRTGTNILADFYRQHKTADPVQSLFRALSAYNTGQAWKGAGYINQILEAAGATYRVLPPEGEFPLKAEATPQIKPRTLRESAAASPLFFDNLSSSMRAGEL